MMKKISASEALYGFAAWLSSREKTLTISRYHECGIMADLVKEYCEINKLSNPRDGWEKHLKMPTSL